MDGEDVFASSSSAFLPLPFRVLSLIGLGILCWATNLHLLHLLGIDTAAILETRSEKLSLSTPPSPWANNNNSISSPPSPPRKPRSPTTLYASVYRLFFAYTIWVLGSYTLFTLAVNGDMGRMDRSQLIIVIAALGVIAALVCPFNILQKRERDVFLHAIRRCLFISSSKTVYFSDVILADIFTSFAKVIGDVWVSIYMLLPGGSLKMSALDITGWSEWAIPVLISLPYVVRFRQCVAEYQGSGFTNTRSLLNAVKYASSFPVIFLSAMQKIVVADVTAAKGTEEALHSTWHGEHAIFRLWLLSVCISTLYSFWWDVTNDWGLELLRSSPPTSTPSARHSGSSINASDLPVSSPLLATPSSSSSQFNFSKYHSHPYGLRSPLFYRPPGIYYAAIFLNLVLRFTWSMKLSTHLHTFAELETGVFVVEACELLRRWLWVFFRVEWEVCKKGMLPVDGMEMREADEMLSVPRISL